MKSFFFLWLIFTLTKVLAERSEGIQIPFEYNNGSYVTDVYLGSNNTKVSLVPDITHNTTYVMNKDVVCSIYGVADDYCIRFGVFDVDASTSSSQLGRYISYWPNVYMHGEWVEDTFEIGGELIKDYSFAVVNDTGVGPGGLGLGLGDFSLGAVMKDLGIIEKNIVAITSDGINGYLELGNYDDSYDFKTYPAKNGTFKLPLTTIDVDGETVDMEIEVLLDIGTKESKLPSSIFAEVLLNLDGYINFDYEDDLRIVIFSCEQPEFDIKFDFDGVTLDVPFHSVVMNTTDGKCSVEFLPDDTPSFGQGILSYGYFVFDLEKEEVYVAAKDLEGGLSIESNTESRTESSTESSSESSSESTDESNESNESESESESTESESTESESSSTSSNLSSKLIPSSFFTLIGLLISI